MSDFSIRLSHAVDDACSDLVAFLQKMVQTSSLPDHEHEVQHPIAEKLRPMGLEVETLLSRFEDLRAHPAFNDAGFSATERINVISRWRGTQLTALESNSEYDVYEEGKATFDARLGYVKERLRLFYVGMTRAKKDLIVTWNTGRQGDATPNLAMSELMGC